MPLRTQPARQAATGGAGAPSAATGEPAPAAAPAAAPVAAPTATPAPAEFVVLQAPKLFNKEGRVNSVKRKATPAREGAEWRSVNILSSGETATPYVQCRYCGKQYCATSARVKDHLLGMSGSAACSGDSAEFISLKETLMSKRSEKHAQQEVKRANKLINSMTSDSGEASSSTHQPAAGVSVKKQQSIISAMQQASSYECDDSVAEFILGCNISFHVLESPYFKRMVNQLKSAPAAYRPPGEKKMANVLLDRTCNRLHAKEEPLRATMLATNGCTVLCDGWDDITRVHLINLIYATAGASFFVGTTKLDSNTHEDASSVANVMLQAIDDFNDGLAVCQVVTDTCATMKAAWREVERKRPWVSCTCCAPHVLNLLLKDIGALPAVASVIADMQRILRQFWGHTRWPRTKLKELTKASHEKELGLYRAKETRFAGKIRELGRALRLKADLQTVVVSKEYSDRGFDSSLRGNRQRDGEDAEVLEDEVEDDDGSSRTVKQILLDERFWSALKEVLVATVSIVKMLRLCDNRSCEVMGKIYYRMFMIGEHLQQLSSSGSPWIKDAHRLHGERWEYLHGRMHAAGYALDPEFLYSGDGGDLDAATMDGLIEVVEHHSLLTTIKRAIDRKHAQAILTVNSPQVQELAGVIMAQFAAFRGKEGVFTKPLVVNSARNIPPSQWWAMYGGHKPELRDVAVSVLKQPVSACAAERNWSVYGSIKGPARSQLQQQTADKRVYCHESLHYLNKLQDAAYTQQVDPWSDDDSADDQLVEADLEV